jgi:cytochrome P450
MVDLLSAYGDDLHDVLRDAARAGPLARDPETGVAVVLRHADVEALGRDPHTVGVGLANFDVVGITDGPLRAWYGNLMFTNEGPAHRRLRSLVQKAFTPRAVDAIRATAAEMADDRSESLRADGGGDLVAAVSTLPLRVILPADRRSRRRCGAVRRLGRRAEHDLRFPHARAG